MQLVLHALDLAGSAVSELSRVSDLAYNPDLPTALKLLQGVVRQRCEEFLNTVQVFHDRMLQSPTSPCQTKQCHYWIPMKAPSPAACFWRDGVQSVHGFLWHVAMSGAWPV